MSSIKTILIFVGIVCVLIIFFYLRSMSVSTLPEDTPDILSDDEKTSVLESLSKPVTGTPPALSDSEKNKVLESLSQTNIASSSGPKPLTDEEKRAILKSLEGR